MKAYAEKLKDPRWQKKRLEIMQRDGFTCVLCNDKETELQVHHLKYSNCEPWEEDNYNLLTVCKDCHFLFEYYKNERSDDKLLTAKKLKSEKYGFLMIVHTDKSFDFWTQHEINGQPLGYRLKEEDVKHLFSILE